MIFSENLLISGSAEEGGGLFSYVQGQLERVDWMTTMGLAMAGRHLVRVLKSPDPLESVTEVLAYDERGVARYDRFDQVGDPHDIAWTGDEYLIVCSIQNRVLGVSPSGKVRVVFEAPGELDSWHINCLCKRDDEWYLSVFGKFAVHHGWSKPENGTSGFLMRLRDGVEIISGLSQPHSPRFVDGKWIICNSATHELLQYGDAGILEKRLQLEGYTRGVAALGNTLVVGESGGRYAANRQYASLCFIDRLSWEIVGRVNVPTKEIYDIIAVPKSIVEGAKTGFRTSAYRMSEHDQFYLFQKAGVEPDRIWAVGDRLSSNGFNVSIKARNVAKTLHVGDVIDLPVHIKNNGDAILVTAPPHPVYVCYRWVNPQDQSFVGAGSWIHTPLRAAIPPGRGTEIQARISAPDSPGSYLLRISLLQEDVAWFDDVNADAASNHRIRVMPAINAIGRPA